MTTSFQGELSHWQSDLDELGRASLRVLAAAHLILGWALVVPHVVALPELGWVSLALLGGAVSTLAAPRLGVRRVAVILVASELIASAAAVRALAIPLSHWSFAVAAGVATALLGGRWGSGAATLATLFLLVNVGHPAPWTDVAALQGIASVWATVFVVWLGLRPVRIALEWAMTSHADARARAEQAERHRGELGRVVKSLSETHERLERLTVELERARQVAEQARVLKARFAAYISHELRTPLNLIIGFSEMMVLAPETYGAESLPASYRGDVTAIYQSARHLATLINDVLDLSQIDAQRMALDRDDVDVGVVIREAVATVQAAYLEAGLHLGVDVPDDLPPLYIDRTRIRQVLINLLGNALHHTARGGVTVSARRQGAEIVVAVRDTGVGIPPDQLATLFDDFRQVSRPGDGERQGSGLGLAISRRFIAMHGGWIRAESCPGEGTTIRFGLPISHAAVEAWSGEAWETTDRLARTPPTAPAVAVLGDDPWLLRLLQRYLEGYRLVVVPEGAVDTARDWKREGVLAIVTSAPTGSLGWARLEQTTATAEGIPILFCTLRGGRETIERLGVADYLDKPISRERLAQTLARCCPGDVARTILVVDDDPNTVRLLARMIRSVAPRDRIVRAHGGHDALVRMSAERPDLVFLDLLMPDLDGYAVLERMREDEVLARIPVVVVTAKGLEDDAIVGDVLALARSGGVPAGDLLRCLQGLLDNLSVATPSTPATEREASPRAPGVVRRGSGA